MSAVATAPRQTDVRNAYRKTRNVDSIPSPSPPASPSKMTVKLPLLNSQTAHQVRRSDKSTPANHSPRTTRHTISTLHIVPITRVPSALPLHSHHSQGKHSYAPACRLPCPTTSTVRATPSPDRRWRKRRRQARRRDRSRGPRIGSWCIWPTTPERGGGGGS